MEKFIESEHFEDMESIFQESMHMDETNGGVYGERGVANPLSTMESVNRNFTIPRTVGLNKYSFLFFPFKQITVKQTQREAIVNVRYLSELLYMFTPIATLPIVILDFYMDYEEANIIFGKIKVLESNVIVVTTEDTFFVCIM